MEFKIKDNILTEIIDPGSELIIPEGVEEIQLNDPIKYKEFTKIILPKSLKYIKNLTFYECNIDYLEINSNIEEHVLDDYTETAIDSCTIQKLNYTDTVTEIAPIIMDGKIEELNMTDSVLSIRTASFIGSKIKNIKLSKNLQSIGDKAFKSVRGLDKINFPESLKIIGNEAFKLSSLKNVTFQEGIRYIGDKAFQGCYIQNINLPESLYEFPKFALKNDAREEKEITVYEDTLKNTRYKIKENQLSENIKIIPNKNKNPLPKAYIENDTLYKVFAKTEDLIVPENVKHIFDDALAYVKMEKIVLPKNLETIGYSSFEGADIKNMDLPKSIKRIEMNAFMDSKTDEIVVPPVKRLGRQAFCNISTNKITISEGITEIGINCFSLTRFKEPLELPNSVEHIGDNAFERCNLKTVILPPNLKTIGCFAFVNNPFTRLDIPESVTFIDNYICSGKDVHVKISNNFKHHTDLFVGADVTLEMPRSVYALDKKYFDNFTCEVFEETLEALLARGKTISEINQIFTKKMQGKDEHEI